MTDRTLTAADVASIRRGAEAYALDSDAKGWLSGKIDALLTDRDALLARLTAAERERDELESELSDWRNGDLRGVQAHMEAFHQRATSAEARLAALGSAGRPVEVAREIACHYCDGMGWCPGPVNNTVHTDRCHSLTSLIASALTAERLAAGGREERMRKALEAVRTMLIDGQGEEDATLIIDAAFSQPAREEDNSRG